MGKRLKSEIAQLTLSDLGRGKPRDACTLLLPLYVKFRRSFTSVFQQIACLGGHLYALRRGWDPTPR